VVETLLKIEFKDEPSAVMPTIAAIATRAAIKPYSMAVAPDSSLDNLVIMPTMGEHLLDCPSGQIARRHLRTHEAGIARQFHFAPFGLL
jgi:hypothetical protein